MAKFEPEELTGYNRPEWAWWCGAKPEPGAMPPDWFAQLSWQNSPGSRYYYSREAAIEAAKAAFEKLPPERQAELRPMLESLLATD